MSVVTLAGILAAADTGGEPGDVPDLLMFSALAGVLMPPLVAIVNSPRWTSLARNIVIVVASILVGAATAWLEGRLTSDRWITSALIVGTAAVASYRTFWNKAAVAIEYKTSSVPNPPNVDGRAG